MRTHVRYQKAKYWREICTVEKSAETQTISFGQLAIWLEYLTPDQEIMSLNHWQGRTMCAN